MDDKLVGIIVSELGERIKYLRSNEDLYQTFWVGVLEAIPNMDTSRDVIPYLISKGFGAVRNYKRSAMSVELATYCEHCGKYFGFRTRTCSECGSELKLIRRFSEYEDYHTKPSDDILNKIMIEQFVKTLEGKQKYVAKRWLIDRADLMYTNYSKQLASELGVSAPNISAKVKKIKQKFRVWHGEENVN